MANILILEDNADFMTELVEACVKAGHIPYEAPNVATLRKIVQDVHCDIALIDLMIPESGEIGANGVKAIREIHTAQRKHEKKTTIIIVSGSAAFMRNEADIRLARALRADGLILKPVSAEDIFVQIEQDYLS